MKHPILVQITKDIKGARKIRAPWRVLLPWCLFCFVVMVACDHFGIFELSMPLLMSIAVFGFFIYLKPGLRHEPLFWSTIAVLAVLHASLIWYVPWTSDQVPRATLAGAASIDLVLMFVILAAVEVLLGERASPDN